MHIQTYIFTDTPTIFPTSVPMELLSAFPSLLGSPSLAHGRDHRSIMASFLSQHITAGATTSCWASHSRETSLMDLLYRQKGLQPEPNLEV